MAGSSWGPMICSAREVVSEVESGPRAISVTRSLFASRSASNMSVRQAYSLFQLTGHTIGVALAPGDIIDHLGYALAFDGGGLEDRNTPVGTSFIMHTAHGFKAQQHGQFGHSLVRTGFVGFTDDEDIGNLENTGLDGLNVIAHAGSRHHHNGVGGTHDLNLCLTRAYRLDHDWIVSRGIHGSHDVTGCGRETSQVATAGHTANKDVGVAGQFHHANAITEDGAAGKRAGRVNGNYTNLAVAAPQFTYEMRDQGAFAGSRSTRHSYDMGMTGMLMQFCQVTAGRRYFVLNQGYHTCQGTAVTA